MLIQKETVQKLLPLCRITAFFGSGMLFSLPYLAGTYAPFAAALCAAADGGQALACLVGALVGMALFQTGLSVVRYFTILLTSAAMQWLCRRVFRLTGVWPRVMCPAVCTLCISLVFLFAQRFSLALLLAVLCETALCAAAVPMFRQALRQLAGKPILPGNAEEQHTVCLLWSLALLPAHLRFFEPFGTAVCLCLMVFGILVVSARKGLTGGLIAGISCAFAYALGTDTDFMCAALALCGCVCAFFDHRRYLQALASFGCCVLGCTFSDDLPLLPHLPAVAVACVVFSGLPAQWLQPRDPATEETRRVSLLAADRETPIARAMATVGDCMTAARQSLAAVGMNTLPNTLNDARESLCRSCDLRESCINEIRDPQHPCYARAAAAAGEGALDLSVFPPDFRDTCYHADQMLHAMQDAYFAYQTRETARRQISRMQTLAGAQFKTFGSLVDAVHSTAQTRQTNRYRRDTVSASAARDFGLDVKAARLCTDAAGHDYFELTFAKPEASFDVTALTQKLRDDTGYALAFPTLVENGNMYTLLFRQQERCRFQIAAAVRPAAGKGVCGDDYRCFFDAMHRQIVLLSDGMGTGSRAAVDSAFTCETVSNLLKAGLGERATVAAVNSAMLLKSTDESLATIDLLRLDSVLGTAEIFKCGAAPTFLFTNGSPAVLEPASTPIGILDSVNMSAAKIPVSAGDILVLVSDGVCGERHRWICGELQSCRNDSAAAIAKHILHCALDRQIGKRLDDMTVIAVCVT